MHALRQTLSLFFLVLVTWVARPAHVYARGGGGCLERGTAVLTPRGGVPVEELKPGDKVLSAVGRSLVEAEVQAVTAVEPDDYCEIVVAGRVLRLTGEHPVEVAPGVFRMANALRAGDAVRIQHEGATAEGHVDSVRHLSASLPAYNLLVLPGGTYLANSIVVHNKGCFLPDTLIRTEDGSEVPISRLRAGDRVLAFTAEGAVTAAVVNNVLIREVGEYRIVKTSSLELRVTAEHPFFVGDATFKTLEALKVGDRIYAYDGTGLSPQSIESIETVATSARVYNLQTDKPNTFFANGVAVHNKGGGGHGGGHSGSHGSSHIGSHSSGGFHGGSSSQGPAAPAGKASWAIPLVTVGLIFAFAAVRLAKRNHSGNLDYVFSEAAVAKKRDKTLKLLDFIAKQDSVMIPDALRKQAETTFLKLQECWQARDFAPMKPLLMADLFQDHSREIQGMIQNHEIDVIDGLRIDRIDLVNVRYTLKEDQREFTALITATACDYYIDDRTRKRLRGDAAPAQFQEFWTFQRLNGAWLLREIEQTRESKALKDDNFFEQFTDAGVRQIYGKDADASGPGGTWLEKQADTKETRIERLLGFLVQTDKIWDEQAMLETSRRVFLEMTAAWESGNPSDIPASDLFPDVAAHLSEEMANNRSHGITMEFRNLCVRKAELILVRNFNDNTKDEFVARIRAHAQRIRRQNGQATQQDQDVTPFEQYLALGRSDNRWKLKEILSAQAGQAALSSENVDEGTNQGQLEWYYQHKRPT
ncbi:MAG: TIM44-like domain-containing protein [Thermoanaerobaculales bacterium]